MQSKQEADEASMHAIVTLLVRQWLSKAHLRDDGPWCHWRTCVHALDENETHPQHDPETRSTACVFSTEDFVD